MKKIKMKKRKKGERQRGNERKKKLYDKKQNIYFQRNMLKLSTEYNRT